MRHASLLKPARRDEGWTFIEALFSVVLVTVVFLGFTITLLAFRELLERAWAIRVMDQYANLLVNDIQRKLRTGTAISLNPGQYGLGSFMFTVPNYNFKNVNDPLQFNTSFKYSANPGQGIMIGVDNTAPQQFDPEFTHEGWTSLHRFSVVAFEYDPNAFNQAGRLPYFYQTMAQITFTLRYDRPRQVETPGGSVNRTFSLEKSYTVSGFMKNRLNYPE